MKKCREKTDFLLLRGMEYHSDHGHILLFGIHDDEVCRKFGEFGPVQKIIDYVNSLGGIAVPSHPYKEKCTTPLKERLFELRNISALETQNRSQSHTINLKAEEAASKLKLPGTGGSDAHYIDDIGEAYTQFPARIKDMVDLVREIKQGNCSAVNR